MRPKKIKSKASDVNDDDIQAELARLRAENARLHTENARLSKLESELRALTISNTGVTQIVQELSISNATALCEAMPTLLPYLKGSEMRLGLVSKDILQAVRDSGIGGVGELPFQDPTAYLASGKLIICALDEMGLQSAMGKIPDDETYTHTYSDESTEEVLKLKKNKKIIMFLLENGCIDAAKEMIIRKLIDFSVKMDIDRIRDTTITESFRVRPMAVAAAYGHLEMMQEMKSIYGNKQLFDTSTIFYASKYGYQDIINWLRSVDYDFEQLGKAYFDWSLGMFYESAGSSQEENIKKWFDEDCTFITPGIKNNATGTPEMVMTTYKGITGAKEMFKFETDETEVVGIPKGMTSMGRGSFDDNNTIYAKLEATVKVKRTGKTGTISYILEHEMYNGKIKAIRAYYNDFPAMASLLHP